MFLKEIPVVASSILPTSLFISKGILIPHRNFTDPFPLTSTAVLASTSILNRILAIYLKFKAASFLLSVKNLSTPPLIADKSTTSINESSSKTAPFLDFTTLSKSNTATS
ncbi:hypothetical protein CRYUN_Cryun20dG0071000 [Craigia yunnanensis]